MKFNIRKKYYREKLYKYVHAYVYIVGLLLAADFLSQGIWSRMQNKDIFYGNIMLIFGIIMLILAVIIAFISYYKKNFKKI